MSWKLCVPLLVVLNVCFPLIGYVCVTCLRLRSCEYVNLHSVLISQALSLVPCFEQEEIVGSCAFMTDFYTVTPLTPHFVGVVRDFSLAGDEPLSKELVQRIKDDMVKYRVLVFKGQGNLSGKRQVQISKQFGTIESTFYKHPKSPHPDIFRVSNDENEGCTNVGRTGWHIDGTFQARPFKYQTMHFHSVCDGGQTWFVPLKEFYEMQDEDTKARWDRYWMLTGRREYAHPMVYQHPHRGDTTMLFHCGRPFCVGWVVDSGENTTTKRKPERLLHADVVQDEVTSLLDQAIDKIGVKMDWEPGDFAINDNLGNCHYAPPGTQNSRRKSGLRILHRTTIAGEGTPTKADGRSSYIFE